jgi:hypothetical protein
MVVLTGEIRLTFHGNRLVLVRHEKLGGVMFHYHGKVYRGEKKLTGHILVSDKDVFIPEMSLRMTIPEDYRG